MLVSIWITLFVTAAASTYGTLTERLPTVIGAAVGIALYIVLAFGALNLVVVGDTGVAFQEANQVLSYLSLAGLVINATYAFADATGQLTGRERPVRGESQ